MSSDSAPDTSSIPLMQQDGASPPLLLCVFIHGFKGTDSTFGGFPERLQHILSQTIEHAKVECTVFPAYETKGELNAAVEKFADWLCNLTVEKEVAHGAGGGAGKAKLVLVGHSMGGLLAADTLIALHKSRVDDTAPLWPNIIACIAFDTPYLGLNPGVFKNQAEQAISYVNTASDIAKSFGFFGAAAKKMSSPAASTDKLALTAPPSASATNQSAVASWAKWAPAVAGAIVTAGAAGAAYYRREDIASSWKWGNDHMKYVGNLWDEKALHARLEALARIRDELGVRFRVYFTVLDSKPAGEPRTFCVLPKKGSREGSFWEPAHNKLAQDEVNAHVSMFDPKVNDGYYDLGLRTAHLVREAMVAASAEVTVEQT